MCEAAVVMMQVVVVVVVEEVNNGRARSCDPAGWATRRLKECCAEQSTQCVRPAADDDESAAGWLS